MRAPSPFSVSVGQPELKTENRKLKTEN